MSTNSQVQAQLRNEVLILQGALKDLHGQLKIPPDKLSVPFWRYPEKKATDVAFSFSAKDIDDDQLLLELLADRLAFLLQSCVFEIEVTNKHCKQSPQHKTGSFSSPSLPLSFSSTLKRFVRGFVQLIKKFKDLDNDVDSMKGEVSQLQQKLLQYHDLVTNELGPSAAEALDSALNTGTQGASSLGISETRTVSTQTTQTSLVAPPVVDYMAKSEPCSKCPMYLEQLDKLAKRVSNLRLKVQRKQDKKAESVGGYDKAVVDANIAAIKDCFVRYASFLYRVKKWIKNITLVCQKVKLPMLLIKTWAASVILA
ncbi:PREDICTED: uncharacterized protein LOC109583193 [Amphimedon queenslandica]|uniref:Uncharacterized protein n=2 Tax=Amphimedon queenslandica TaxID=400682 RepID=A0AAN0JB77_AMPQE|nr:PREDICTED: uncharacterized protein LOC109583193 [Amphimedon queenslandica]|eukprot:XP_019853996.1 PREDICTED: uncharacterized protein LOC109583193 [Amphimedon queenslandica]